MLDKAKNFGEMQFLDWPAWSAKKKETIQRPKGFFCHALFGTVVITTIWEPH